MNAIDGVGGEAMFASSDVGAPEIASCSRDGSVKVVKYWHTTITGVLQYRNSLRSPPAHHDMHIFLLLKGMGCPGKGEASGMYGANRRGSQA